jgi:hypothetical protein
VTCAIVPVPFGVPAIAVLPRGWTDVSREPTETHTVTLELDAFNRRFIVHLADPRAAVAFLDQRMMDALVRLPLRVAVHVHEDRMLLVAPELEPGEMIFVARGRAGPRDARAAGRVEPVSAAAGRGPVRTTMAPGHVVSRSEVGRGEPGGPRRMIGRDGAPARTAIRRACPESLLTSLGPSVEVVSSQHPG